MMTASTTAAKRRTWLLIGLLALVTVLVIVARTYRTSTPEDWQEILQQPGFPAARRGMSLSQEGKKLLPVEERREMDIFYAEALQSLTPTEKQQFWTLVQKGTTATDREIRESVDLMQRALHSLPLDKRTRLFALIEKAVQLQLTRQKRAEN